MRHSYRPDILPKPPLYLPFRMPLVIFMNI